MRAWYIGCALGLQPREEISIISVRSKVSCGCRLLAWHRTASPTNRVRFSASAPLFMSSVSSSAGVAQVEERRSRKAEVGVSNIPSGSSFDMGESFNGRTAGLQPADGGSIPSSSTIFVRDAVAELRRSDNKCGRGRVDRRRSVERSTRIQFPPATPNFQTVHRPTGQGPALRRLRFRFESGWAGQSHVSSFGSEEDGKSAAFGPQRHWVRLPGSRPKFFRGSQVGKAPHC